MFCFIFPKLSLKKFFLVQYAMVRKAAQKLLDFAAANLAREKSTYYNHIQNAFIPSVERVVSSNPRRGIGG